MRVCEGCWSGKGIAQVTSSWVEVTSSKGSANGDSAPGEGLYVVQVLSSDSAAIREAILAIVENHRIFNSLRTDWGGRNLRLLPAGCVRLSVSWQTEQPEPSFLPEVRHLSGGQS